jgi:antirestriction protein ArdC
MDLYQSITNQIVAMLERGTVPWHRPWTVPGPEGLPKNLVSRQPYRGINVFILLASQYDSPYWLTFNQAKKLGGHINKGERSSMVVFWNWLDKETGELDSNGNRAVEKIPFLRYYNVFNVSQCTLPDGLVPALPERPAIEPIAECDRIVAGMPSPPAINHNGSNRAYYRQATDSVHMPERHRFPKQEEYYSTLFHELAHSTGHSSRLNRKTLTEYDGFGGQNYSREELVAEMGAAFLCGMAGIENQTIDNSASYVASWLQALKADKRLAVTAAAQAQKAADYILDNKSPESR